MDASRYVFGSEPERLRVSRSHGDPAVVIVAGELDVGTVPRVMRAIAAVLADYPQPQTIVLDLALLTSLSAPATRILRVLANQVAGEGVAFRVTTGLNPRVRQALALTGLDSILDVYVCRSTALHAGDRRQFLELMSCIWNP
jgi:anti-anti-sigma factor